MSMCLRQNFSKLRPSPTQARPSQTKPDQENSLDFLGFPRPKCAFSMGYERLDRKKQLPSRPRPEEPREARRLEGRSRTRQPRSERDHPSRRDALASLLRMRSWAPAVVGIALGSYRKNRIFRIGPSPAQPFGQARASASTFARRGSRRSRDGPFSTASRTFRKTGQYRWLSEKARKCRALARRLLVEPLPRSEG